MKVININNVPVKIYYDYFILVKETNLVEFYIRNASRISCEYDECILKVSKKFLHIPLQNEILSGVIYE